MTHQPLEIGHFQRTQLALCCFRFGCSRFLCAGVVRIALPRGLRHRCGYYARFIESWAPRESYVASGHSFAALSGELLPSINLIAVICNDARKSAVPSAFLVALVRVTSTLATSVNVFATSGSGMPSFFRTSSSRSRHSPHGYAGASSMLAGIAYSSGCFGSSFIEMSLGLTLPIGASVAAELTMCFSSSLKVILRYRTPCRRAFRPRPHRLPSADCSLPPRECRCRVAATASVCSQRLPADER